MRHPYAHTITHRNLHPYTPQNTVPATSRQLPMRHRGSSFASGQSWRSPTGFAPVYWMTLPA
eukprot:6698388-Pyramimonas_sp.AAC.1